MTRIYKPCKKCHRRTNSRYRGKPFCITHRKCARGCGRKARQCDEMKRPICAACVMVGYRKDRSAA